MRRPAVTVIVATYDRLPLLKKALASVKAQEFRNWELIVADGGSSDGTEAFLRKRGRFWDWMSVPGNPGPVILTNRAAARARGELLAFLDSDDVWHANYLARMAGAFERPRVQAALSDFFVMDDRERVFMRYGLADQRRRTPQARNLAQSLSVLAWFPSFTVVRRSAFEKLGGYDEVFRWTGFDVDLTKRIADEFGPRAFAWIEEPLGRRRNHAGQVTRPEHQPCWPPDPRLLKGKFGARQKDILLDAVYFARKHRSTRALLGA